VVGRARPPIDEAQYGLDQGPCLSAIRLHGTFEAADLGTDERWPLRSGPTTVRLSMTLAELRQHFTKSHAAHVLVTTLSGQLVGLVRAEDPRRDQRNRGMTSRW